MEREWSCYGGGQFNGGIMIMLERWSVLWRESGCYGGHQPGGHQRVRGGQFNGGSMFMLHRWSV